MTLRRVQAITDPGPIEQSHLWHGCPAEIGSGILWDGTKKGTTILIGRE
jgi:hypothetical protein